MSDAPRELRDDLKQLRNVTAMIGRGEPPLHTLSSLLTLGYTLAGGQGAILNASQEQFEALAGEEVVGQGRHPLTSNAELVLSGPIAAELRSHAGDIDPCASADRNHMIVPHAEGAILLLHPNLDLLQLPEQRLFLRMVSDLVASELRRACQLRRLDKLGDAGRQLERLRREIDQRDELLQALSVIDDVTGLHNRRFFDQRLTHEILRFYRYQRPLSLMIFDIDNFRSINEACGQAVGDATLKHIGELAKKTHRNVDLVARFAGEKFAVLMPDTDVDGACRAAERLREKIAANPTEVSGMTLQVTVSIGVAGTFQGEPEAKSLISAAEAALTRARQQGQNRVDRESGA